jgi:hypothetical protein
LKDLAHSTTEYNSGRCATFTPFPRPK